MVRTISMTFLSTLNSNSNSTFIVLNLRLFTDSWAHNPRKQKYIILKPETSQVIAPQRKTEARPEY